MSGVTWSKFYWADWESDEKLKLCSPGAQALWMRMLCVCAKADGYLTIAGRKLGADDMAILTGWPVDDVRKWWAELAKWEVFSVEGRGKIYSRKMVKDARKAAVARENGQNGGNPNLRKDRGSGTSDNQNGTDDLTDRPGRLPRAKSQKKEDASASSRGAAAAKAPKGKPTKRKPETPLPEGFPDAEAMDDARARIRAEGANISAEHQAERFRNHALQTDRRCRDWRAAWRNWVLIGVEEAPKGRAQDPELALPLPSWPGPADLRAAIVAARDEGFARSYLDPAGWRNGPDRLVLCRNEIAAKKLNADVPEVLREFNVRAVAEASFPQTDRRAG